MKLDTKNLTYINQKNLALLSPIFSFPPAIGALGHDTVLTTIKELEASPGILSSLLEKHERLVIQEFVPEIRTTGEYSYVFLGGKFSHAVRKHNPNGGFRIHQASFNNKTRF